MKRVLSITLRCLLTPALVAVSLALLCTIATLPRSLDRESAILPAGVGVALCLVLCAFGIRFLRLYVFGHELTHWLAAKCFLRRTGDMDVARASGSVAIERPNIWIVLAPYFVPVYTLVWIGGWGVFRFLNRAPSPAVVQGFYVGIGFTYAFHLVLTTQALLRQQEDLRMYGRMFSLAVIVCCNLLLLFVALTAAGRQWGTGFGLLEGYLVIEWHLLARFVVCCRGLCGI